MGPSAEAGLAQSVKVAICVITYKRPLGFAELLAALAELEVDNLELGSVDVAIFVADNDPDGSAGPAVAAATANGSGRWPIHYEVEPGRGIPRARNRTLRMARAWEPDIISFMDDDEFPRPDWLASLLATMERSGADVVLGTRIAEYAATMPTWLVDGGFFQPARFATNEHYPFYVTPTSAVICRAGVLPADGFKEEMALTGGSDRVLWTEVERRGGVFVYDDEAVVRMPIPESPGVGELAAEAVVSRRNDAQSDLSSSRQTQPAAASETMRWCDCSLSGWRRAHHRCSTQGKDCGHVCRSCAGDRSWCGVGCAWSSLPRVQDHPRRLISVHPPHTPWRDRNITGSA